VSRYCGQHARADRAYGHPLGKRLLPRHYAAERREVARFIRRNREDQSIRTALAFFQRWLELAASGDTDVPAPAQIARLAKNQVSALEMLCEAGAVWAYSERNQRALIDDERLTCALGNSISHLAPLTAIRKYEFRGKTLYRYSRVPKAERMEIGETIRRTLGVLLQAVTEAIEPRPITTRRVIPLHQFKLMICHPTIQ